MPHWPEEVIDGHFVRISVEKICPLSQSRDAQLLRTNLQEITHCLGGIWLNFLQKLQGVVSIPEIFLYIKINF